MRAPSPQLPPPGDLRVTALGTGRPFPRLAQVNSGFLIELGNGDTFVFDFGHGSFGRFASLGIPMSRLTALFTTHLHTDHVGDLAACWIGARVGGRAEPLAFFGRLLPEASEGVDLRIHETANPAGPRIPYDDPGRAGSGEAMVHSPGRTGGGAQPAQPENGGRLPLQQRCRYAAAGLRRHPAVLRRESVARRGPRHRRAAGTDVSWPRQRCPRTAGRTPVVAVPTARRTGRLRR